MIHSPSVFNPSRACTLRICRRHLLHLPSSFLEKVKRRNVGRVAILYIVVCYLILETAAKSTSIPRVFPQDQLS
jgi:hypothetical protein